MRPDTVKAGICAFLGVTTWQAAEYKQYHAIPSQGMDPETRRRLLDYFAPHTEWLFKLLGTRYDWNA